MQQTPPKLLRDPAPVGDVVQHDNCPQPPVRVGKNRPGVGQQGSLTSLGCSDREFLVDHVLPRAGTSKRIFVDGEFPALG